jgi:hypothetical protein
VALKEKQAELVVSIGLKLIPKGDDQSNQKETTRKKKCIPLKDIYSE